MHCWLNILGISALSLDSNQKQGKLWKNELFLYIFDKESFEITFFSFADFLGIILIAD